MATEAQSIAKGGLLRAALAVAIVPLNQANTDFTFQVPVGARDVKFSTKTVTAMGAVTDAQLQIGKTVGGAEYVAGVSIKAQGEVTHTLVGAGVADLDSVPGTLGSTTTFTARLVQSGGSSATGAATLYVSYLPFPQ